MIVGADVARPIFLLCLLAFMLYRHRVSRFELGYVLCLGAFGVYLFEVIRYTLLPLVIESTFINTMRAGPGPFADVNLVPFKSGMGDAGWLSRQSIGNVLLAVPFGFGSVFVSNLSPRRIVFVGAAFGGTIELVQLLMNVVYGFPYRTVDVTDIVLNWFGVLLGLGCFVIASRLYSIAFRGRPVVGGLLRHPRTVLVAGRGQPAPRRNARSTPDRDGPIWTTENAADP